MGLPPIIKYKDKRKPHSWCKWAVSRVKNKNNSINVRFVGDTGSGKSWSALFFGEECARMMGKEFTINNVYFSIKDVLKEVANNEPPPGTIFLIDEQQVEAEAESHQSKRARAYKTFLSTVRSNRYIIITTLPFADMELKKIRRFFPVEIETHGADKNRKTVKSTPRFLEYSRKQAGKIYYKRLVLCFTDDNGMRQIKKVDYWDIPKPSQSLIDIYETRKKEFKRKLYKKLVEELNLEDGEKEEKKFLVASNEAVEQKLTDYQRGVLKYFRQGVKTQNEISDLLTKDGFYSTPQKLSGAKNSMIKKGIILYPTKDLQ